MSKRFIKFIPSEKSEWLQEHYPNAFLLLSQIARRARRTENSPDGREIGEAHIGDYKKAGIETEKRYRTAKKVLEDFGYIRIVETRRSLKGRLKNHKSTKNGENRATQRATKGTLVKLLDSDIWDVNISVMGECEGDQRATKGRLKGDEQERKERKEDIRTPSPKGVPSNRGDGGGFEISEEVPKASPVERAQSRKEGYFQEMQRRFGEAFTSEHFEAAWTEMQDFSKKESIRNPLAFLMKKIDDYLIYGIPELPPSLEKRSEWIHQNQREAALFAQEQPNGTRVLCRDVSVEIVDSRGIRNVSYALPPEDWRRETWFLLKTSSA